MTALLAQGAALFRRLRGRPDSEHEMSFNRVAFALVAYTATLLGHLNAAAVPILIAFCIISFAVFAQQLRDTSVNATRRAVMVVVDLAMILAFMALNDAGGAGFWPLLLWTVLGNGFRFGPRYLFGATAVAMTGFAGVIWATPFWRDHLPLSIGLMIGLLALPLYANRLIRKLSSATAAAEEASRAKSYFLASVSHELRTPLNAIIGLGEHLAAATPEAEHRATAGTIVSAGQQLLTMINRLLDFSRYEMNGEVAETRPFDLARLLSSVRELMEHQAVEKGLTLNLHLAADTPTALIGDEAHLRDVLINLVGNALKFTETGAITIVGELLRDEAGARVRLTVADTGIGIAPEAQEHIFGSFRQADDTIIDRYGGTGLGLAICRELATLMGGEIGVDSAPGRGSRFWLTARVEIDEAPAPPAAAPRLLLYSADPALEAAIGRGVVRRDTRAETRALFDKAVPSVVLVDARLLAEQVPEEADLVDVADNLRGGAVPILLADESDPLPSREAIERCFVSVLPRAPAADVLDRAVATALALGGRPGATAAVAPLPVTPRRILVADDNAMNRKVFGMILGRAGHVVTFADDGERALDLMRDAAFDVVLMDVNMPNMNGIEATKLYRFASLGKGQVPVVAVTADASPATAERCLDAGMVACVAKPVDSVALLALIERLAADEPAPVAVPAFDPAGVVTPLFGRGAPAPAAIDWSSIAELQEMGGRDFVTDLLDIYARDGAMLVGAVRAAVAEGDVAAFRSNAHALRSSAANVGATTVAELCLHLQRIGEAEFRERGAEQAERLHQAVTQASSALTGWLGRSAGAL